VNLGAYSASVIGGVLSVAPVEQIPQQIAAGRQQSDSVPVQVPRPRPHAQFAFERCTDGGDAQRA
jgi:hypothetical protein